MKQVQNKYLKAIAVNRDYSARNSAIADKPRDAFRGQSKQGQQTWYHFIC